MAISKLNAAAPERRIDDKPEIPDWQQYRSDRVFAARGKWYFHTREKTVEGPFENRLAAEYRIDVYIQIMKSAYLGISADCSPKLP